MAAGRGEWAKAARRAAGGAAVGLAAGLLTLVVHLAGGFDPVESISLDWRQRYFSRAGGEGDASRVAERFPGPVGLIYLGEPSLAASRKAGIKWPWYREMWGDLLRFLKADGARLAAYDLIFSEGSAYGAEDDEAFRGALAECGMAYFVLAFSRAEAAVDATALARIEALAPEVELEDAAQAGLFPEAGGIESVTLPEFLGAARGVGNAQHAPDPDGVYRRIGPFVRFRGRLYPTLGLAVARDFLGGGAPIRVTRDRVLVVGAGAGERRIPLERDGSMLLRFSSEVRTAHYAAAEAYDAVAASGGGEAAAALSGAFRGKAVIVGYAAPGLYDVRPNPIMPSAPGMLVHATAAMNIVEGRPLRTWTRLTRAPLVAALLGLGALVGALVTSTPLVRRQVAALAAAALAWFGFAAWWAFARDLAVDLVAPEVAAAVAFAGSALLNYATEGRQRRLIKDAFQHYLSPAFVEELLKDPSKLRLGGERRELTIFFSDLAGFTTMSEKLEPEELVRILNQYLTRMTTIILRHGGTHDKYEGDAIMCFFGAPVPVPRHATLCCKAALEQQAEIARLNEEWKGLGLPKVHARMGVNTGSVVVGNMGSEQTMDYTVMGDSVNLASRLEGANKPFGTLTMVGERTKELAEGDIDFRELAGLRVKGKTKPVRVYEILGERGKTEPSRLETARRFEEGLRRFEARDFQAAAAIFRELKERGDPPATLYLEECLRFAKEAPPPEWDGVITLTSK